MLPKFEIVRLKKCSYQKPCAISFLKTESYIETKNDNKCDMIRTHSQEKLNAIILRKSHDILS